MKTAPPFVYTLAKAISLIGHPLITLPIASSYIAFQQWPLKNALILSAALLGGIVLPVSWHNYQKVKKGHYTNFDVSNQQQRAQFYPLLIGLVALVTGLLFATGQPKPFCYGAIHMLVLLLISYGTNYFIKASLHTSLSFFLTWAIYSSNPVAGMVMGIFSILIAISRLILSRHTLLEIVVGALIGLVIGADLYRPTR